MFKSLPLTLASAVILLSMATLPVCAQGESQKSREANERDIAQRELNLRMLEKRSGKNAKRRDTELTPAQLQEDFTRIQVVNNDLAETVVRGGTLDLNFVARSASEIKERAERLMVNLALPKPEKDDKPPKPLELTNTEQLKHALSKLDELIGGFAHNPVFKEARPDDAQLSTKARRDLAEIIALSNEIRKSSEDLSKTEQKWALPDKY